MLEIATINGDDPVVYNRKMLRAFCEALVQFRNLSSTMPVGEAYMFLLVALNEGASLTDLAVEADMKKSTASRYLLDLSDKQRTGAAGFGLVVRESDPNELRKNMYALTPKGRKIVAALVNAGLKA